MLAFLTVLGASVVLVALVQAMDIEQLKPRKARSAAAKVAAPRAQEHNLPPAAALQGLY